MNILPVGEGKVHLLSGGGKIYTDIAARFCRSELDAMDIVNGKYNPELVKTIISSRHMAATEFDNFLFAVEGYSRSCEVQLVRKRHASYLIKSGRVDKLGKRSFDMVMPPSLIGAYSHVAHMDLGEGVLEEWDAEQILELIEEWYNAGVKLGYPEEDLRFLKPQATEFKGIIGMNAHALSDFFKVRCCKNAQTEIRDMANKMLKLVREVAPDLFATAGASCVGLGYCPENSQQHPSCAGIPTHDKVMEVLARHKVGIHDLG